MKYRYDNRKKYDIKEACRKYGFRASEKFWNVSQIGILTTWNGIGGKNGLKPPKTAYGLNVELPSAPHDIDYEIGENWYNFDKANEDYLYNNYQVIDKESIWFLKWLRKRRMYKYYLAVKIGGDEYFWTPEKLKRMGLSAIPPRPEPKPKLRVSIFK